MTRRVFLGIDPGLDGAIALAEANAATCVLDLPSLPAMGNKGRVLNLHALQEWMESVLSGDVLVFATIEDVHAMPKQGVRSVFTFGRVYGELRGLLVARHANLRTVRPQDWKRAMGLPRNSPKDAARTAVTERYPHLAYLVRRKKDHNRADAILLAHYGEGLYSGAIQI